MREDVIRAAEAREGNNAKPYQVKQVRAVILKYKLGEVE